MTFEQWLQSEIEFARKAVDYHESMDKSQPVKRDVKPCKHEKHPRSRYCTCVSCVNYTPF